MHSPTHGSERAIRVRNWWEGSGVPVRHTRVCSGGHPLSLFSPVLTPPWVSTAASVLSAGREDDVGSALRRYEQAGGTERTLASLNGLIAQRHQLLVERPNDLKLCVAPGKISSYCKTLGGNLMRRISRRMTPRLRLRDIGRERRNRQEMQVSSVKRNCTCHTPQLPFTVNRLARILLQDYGAQRLDLSNCYIRREGCLGSMDRSLDPNTYYLGQLPPPWF